MILSHIVAVSENDAIGVKNDLPWTIPEDLKFFKDKTLNSVMIMGRKTYDSIGFPLPKRISVVVSKSAKASDFPAGVLLAGSIPEAIELARSVAESKSMKEIFIVGGGEIYKQTLDLVDKVYLTRVHVSVSADAYYPKIEDKNFKMISEKPSENEKYKYTFYEYEQNT